MKPETKTFLDTWCAAGPGRSWRYLAGGGHHTIVLTYGDTNPPTEIEITTESAERSAEDAIAMAEVGIAAVKRIRAERKKDHVEWLARKKASEGPALQGMGSLALAKTMLRYQLQGAIEAGVTGHPQRVVGELAEKHCFRVLDSEPVSIADIWLFWIESDREPDGLPEWLEIRPWTEPEVFRKS